MRNPDRIDAFIDTVIPKHTEDVIVKIWGIPKDELVENFIGTISTIKETIKEVWKEYPDYRFSQILIKLGFPNYPGFWFYIEENEILQKLSKL